MSIIMEYTIDVSQDPRARKKPMFKVKRLTVLKQLENIRQLILLGMGFLGSEKSAGLRVIMGKPSRR